MTSFEASPSAYPPLGEIIRAQRRLAELSLRDMAAMTQVSNAYLSQVERGLHQPSLRVLRAISEALQLPLDHLVAATESSPEAGTQAEQDRGSSPESAHVCSTEKAIVRDPQLTAHQRAALLTVYRSFVEPEDEPDLRD